MISDLLFKKAASTKSLSGSNSGTPGSFSFNELMMAHTHHKVDKT